MKTNNPEYIKNYYFKIVEFEKSFYELFFLERFKDIVSLKYLYLVKTIGDEYWYIYLYKSENEKIKFLHLVEELTLKEPFKYRIATNKVSYFCKDENLITHKYKFYIDYFCEITNYSVIRINEIYKFLVSKFENLNLDTGNDGSSTAKLNEVLIPYLEILGLHGSVQDNQKDQVVIPNRFDPIGLNVDLFFRCNKKIKTPGKVHIGDNLYKELNEEEKNKYRVTKSFTPKGFDKNYRIYKSVVS